MDYVVTEERHGSQKMTLKIVWCLKMLHLQWMLTRGLKWRGELQSPTLEFGCGFHFIIIRHLLQCEKISCSETSQYPTGKEEAYQKMYDVT